MEDSLNLRDRNSRFWKM